MKTSDKWLKLLGTWLLEWLFIWGLFFMIVFLSEDRLRQVAHLPVQWPVPLILSVIASVFTGLAQMTPIFKDPS